MPRFVQTSKPRLSQINEKSIPSYSKTKDGREERAKERRATAMGSIEPRKGLGTMGSDPKGRRATAIGPLEPRNRLGAMGSDSKGRRATAMGPIDPKDWKNDFTSGVKANRSSFRKSDTVTVRR